MKKAFVCEFFYQQPTKKPSSRSSHHVVILFFLSRHGVSSTKASFNTGVSPSVLDLVRVKIRNQEKKKFIANAHVNRKFSSFVSSWGVVPLIPLVLKGPWGVGSRSAISDGHQMHCCEGYTSQLGGEIRKGGGHLNP